MKRGATLLAVLAMAGLLSAVPVTARAAVEATVQGNPDTVIIAVAGSDNEDPKAAAIEAARAAIEACQGQARGLIVYEDTGTDEQPATEQVVAGLQEVVGDLPYIGTHAVPLLSDRTIPGGVGVMAIGGRRVQVAAAVAPLDRQRKNTANQLAQGLKSLHDPRLIFVLSEPTLSFEPDKDVTVEDFLVGMKDNFGETPIFGGNCKPHDGMVGYQFINGDIHTSSVVGMAISGPFRTVADHTTEFYPMGEAATVTKGIRDPQDGKWWILELNGRPAAQVYREIRGMAADEPFTYDDQHPIGVVVSPTRRYLRMVLDEGGTKPENQAYAGGIKTISEVPVGTKIFVLGFPGQEQAIYDSARESVRDMLERAQGDPLAVLASDCCARGFRLGAFTENQGDEITQAIRPALGEARLPIFGFYAYGEIGPIRGPFKDLNYMYQQHTFVGMILVAEEPSAPGARSGLIEVREPIQGCYGRAMQAQAEKEARAQAAAE